jgi:RNA polymerase sigma-70 factor (ECF subfamily)
MKDPRRGDADDELLVGVARGDARSLESLYKQFGRSVYSLALGILKDSRGAEEVTQEVFLSVWRSAREFDPKRGKARTWILSLAHHKRVDALRRQRLRVTEPLAESLADEQDVAEKALQAVDGTRVHEALRALPATQREVLALAYYGGFTQREIANKLSLPLGTVKTRMRDGFIRLRDKLRASSSYGIRGEER